ncbi:cation transporter [Clostridium transplantifaecale]|nr:cation transporter [Clostridium transplantifaecale]
MKKSMKLMDLDCAYCASKIEEAVNKVGGVAKAEMNFLSQK